MGTYPKDRGIGERLAILEGVVEQLRRTSRTLYQPGALFATSLHGMVYEDTASPNWVTYFETHIRPARQLDIGLVFLGDQVSGTNTGGAWQIKVAGTVISSATGTVTANFSYQFASALIDLTSYPSNQPVLIEVQGQRTSGATTGGKYGTGGTLGIGIRWANFS